MKYDNLNKETFWNELQEKYPAGMKVFCDWIDKYKEENNWNSLFAANEDTDQLHSSRYKYHEIPLYMQIGIFIEFIESRGGCQWDVDLMDIDWREEIAGHMELIHNLQLENEEA